MFDHMSPTFQATLVQVIQVLISLVGAYVVLRLLRGTAIVKRKGLQLGGAAAMFVVILVLLNRFLPGIQQGIVKESEAAQPVIVRKEESGSAMISKAVLLYPSTQIVTKRDLSTLDKNRYIVDDKLGIAIKRPVDNTWEYNAFDSVEIVSETDVPTFQSSLDIFKPLLFGTKKPTIVGLRKIDGVEIQIDKTSMIQQISFGYNLYSDPSLVTSVVRSTIDPKVISEDLVKQTTLYLQDQSSRKIDASFPMKKIIHSRIYITIIDKEELKGELTDKVMPTSTLLDRAMSFKSFTNGSLFTTHNLYVNQEIGLASSNWGVELSRVIVNGRETNVRINEVSFIVAGPTRAVFVDLLYPTTDSPAVFQELEEIIKSLQFTG